MTTTTPPVKRRDHDYDHAACKAARLLRRRLQSGATTTTLPVKLRDHDHAAYKAARLRPRCLQSGAGLLRRSGALAEHVLQDAAVRDVLDLLRRVDTRD